MSDLTLYHYWRSSSSWRVRWALKLKSIAYNPVSINLLKREHRTEEFKKLNPLGFVPVLKKNNLVLADSLAIIEWLEAEYPSTYKILPGSNHDQALIRQLAYIISSSTQPIQNPLVAKEHSNNPARRVEWMQHWISEGLSSYERFLTDHSCHGTWSFGSQVTLADLCLIPQCYNAERYGVDLGQTPVLAGIYRRARSLNTCQKSSPEAFEADHSAP